MEDQEYSPLIVEDERSLVSTVTIGILVGWVLWSVLGVVICRVGAPDYSWLFAIAVGCFAGLWGGLFFGSAAAVAVHGHRAEKAEAAERAAHLAQVRESQASALRLADVR